MGHRFRKLHEKFLDSIQIGALIRKRFWRIHELLMDPESMKGSKILDWQSYNGHSSFTKAKIEQLKATIEDEDAEE